MTPFFISRPWEKVFRAATAFPLRTKASICLPDGDVFRENPIRPKNPV